MITLVTGATGLLGNNLVRTLLDRGQAVRVLLRENSDPRPLEGLDVQRATGDVRDAASVDRACQGVGRVLHAAAKVHIGWSGSDEHQAINVVGTRNVAQAALKQRARMVHISSVDTLGIQTKENPAHEESPVAGHILCPYVLSKRGAEAEVLALVEQGLEAMIVNPAYTVGPWDWKPSSGRMLLEIARGWGTFAPPGGNDFADVRDVCEGVLAAAERGVPGRRYILAGHSLSYFDVWRLFAEITGSRPPRFVVDRLTLRAAGRFGDLWGRIIGKEPDVNSAAAAISAMPHHFSSARARQELGYSCRPIRETVAAAWDWFRQYGYA
jgi:dihydroflavonol-4-reductase